jgi:hypothetical protein
MVCPGRNVPLPPQECCVAKEQKALIGGAVH